MEKANDLDSEQEAQSPKRPPEGRIRRRARKLLWRLHWLAPSIVPHPDPETEYRRSRDRESNSCTRVPEGEGLRLKAVWGVEVFGPNESEALYKGLAKLGWAAGSNGPGEAVEWVRNQRAYGWRGGSWYNVGLVVRPSDRRRYIGLANTAPMPEAVERMIVCLRQITPALTCVIACFEFKPEASTKYEDVLAGDRMSETRRGPLWSLRTLGPEHLKEEALAAARASVAEMVQGWFARLLPGYFCSLSDADRLPVTEFLTTEEQHLFAVDKKTPYFNWQRVVANVSIRDVWASKEFGPLRFALVPEKWPREERPRLIQTIRTSEVPDEKLRGYGDPSSALSFIVHEHTEGLIAHFAIVAYLMERGREVKLMRESIRPATSKRHILRTIDRIQQFFDRNMGAPAIARELIESSKRPQAFAYACGSFSAPGWADDPPRDIAESIRARIESLASQLLDDDASTRQQCEQLSSILSVRESVRAQRRMEFLTVVALIVGLTSMLAAVAAIPEKWMAEIPVLWDTAAKLFF